ncbi:GTP-binding protein [Patiriisocius marinus]|uniref:GTP-binding protein n=1 Tax=Patiriisocius marinus TaxID=1397112 RepID=A0A5J4IP28_9FLAO|nr:GTP-binding protein [Patiriisocius marinus]GER59375.1 hypothetical protein ULMA_14830 [Patiriisocius marinus]
MELSNEIVLRPRFTIESTDAPDKLLATFEESKTHTVDFVISRIDDHVFIRIPKNKQHFWSPQLHLEIYKIESQPTIIKGLYGPNPTVWTMFMFLHFVVGTLFIGAGVWMYTNIALGDPFIFPIVALITLFIMWFVLYFSGRLGKQAGKKEMLQLQAYFYETLKKGHSSLL